VFVSETSVRGDLEWGTTPRLLHSSAERFSAREAIVDVSDGRTLSFAGLATAAHDAARAFLAMGIERGDRVAIWAPNMWEWVVAALGLHSAGAVLVPLNTRFKGREAAYILGKSRAKALVTITGFLDTDYVALLRQAVDVDTELPDLEAIVVLRGEAPDGTSSWAEFLAAGTAVRSVAKPGSYRGPGGRPFTTLCVCGTQKRGTSINLTTHRPGIPCVQLPEHRPAALYFSRVQIPSNAVTFCKISVIVFQGPGIIAYEDRSEHRGLSNRRYTFVPK